MLVGSLAMKNRKGLAPDVFGTSVPPLALLVSLIQTSGHKAAALMPIMVMLFGLSNAPSFFLFDKKDNTLSRNCCVSIS